MRYFTKGEWGLWMGSLAAVVGSYFLFDSENAGALIASLIGVTSLIFNAKGNPIGQVLMVIFSLLYGIISYGYCYYGEMITYLGMTLPMALLALISWLKHPYKGEKAQVEIGKMSKRAWESGCVLTIFVTVTFYFILKFLNTANLLPSTISVTTSFFAAYLTYMRSAWFAVAYAANDVVLIVLWILAAEKDPSCVSVIVCFAAFLINDLYGFINWRRMERKQRKDV